MVFTDTWERLKPLLTFYLAELWRRWRTVLLLSVIGILALGWLLGIPTWQTILVLAFVMTFLLGEIARQVYRFGRRVRQFHKVIDKPVKVFIAPELKDATNWFEWSQKVLNAQAELERLFGFTLKRTVSIFVFPTMAEISRLFGVEMGGGALPEGDGILMACDNLQTTSFPDEIFRHELAHIFSAHLGEDTPAFKREGLSVWVQGSESGKPVDFHALAVILGGNDIPLLTLLSDSHFQANKHSAYPLSGSFTGYLVRRFGWETYRCFYAAATAENFERIFEQIFGISLMMAEREWKQSLMARRNEFEPELSLWIRRWRLQAMYNAWQLWLCIEEAEALLRDGDDNWGTIWYAATSHSLVGNYERALELLLQLTERDDAELQPYKVVLWRQLGILYDLLGQREKAIAAYQKALEFPDWWDDVDGSTHERVRRHLRQPYTERELYERLRRRIYRR